MIQEEKNTNLDLDLRLSPPGMHSQHNGSSNGFEISPSPPSQQSCMSFEWDLNESPNSTNNIIEIPSLTLVGCTNCLMYVMVPEVDPKCPKCKSYVLIDMSRQSLAKRFRKC